MRLLGAFLLIGLVLGTAARVGADGGGGTPPSSSAAREDPTYVEGVNAVKRGDYPAAIRHFEAVVAKDDRNANAYNWLAYSTRKNGDAAKAVPIYEKALAIDPKHRGAHEYIGEAYLQLDRPQEAQQHLAKLDSLCTFGCTEYRMLKAAIADYKAGKKPTN